MNGSNLGRSLFFIVLILTGYVLVIFRLFYWQIVKSEYLKEIAVAQSQESIILYAKRGEIIASDNFPLGTNTFSDLLFANPKVMGDKKHYAELLSPILGRPSQDLEDLLSQNLFWVKLSANLDFTTKKEVEKLNLEGLGFQQTINRYYPEASMAAQLIGFVGKNERGGNQGYFGLEGYYNEQLSGRDGKIIVIHDALSNPVFSDIREEKNIDGRTLFTTIDRTVQYIAEKRLLEGIASYEAEGGSVIILSPQTGKILAMASFPRFDPQQYYHFDYQFYKNPAISSLYEPGSTFKVLVMSAAIDLGVVKPDTKCTMCDKPVVIGDYTIKTWNEKYFPESSMTEVIQHSDNVGMVFVGQKIGLSSLISYLKKFGIGERSGIDLQGEVTSGMKDEEEWYPIDLATASFGQGLSVTPLQLLVGVSAIANDGVLMKPIVVSRIIDEKGKKIEIKPKIKYSVIKATTARLMTEMMVNAVEKGEAKWTKIDNYKIAGKTGTAQIPVAGHYDPEKTIASFVGFFPADTPKISMLVLVDRPKTSKFGSETAAPIFFNIARDLIRYYNIPPSY